MRRDVWTSLRRLCGGKAGKADVDSLSLWFKESVETAWQPEDQNDKDFQIQLSYVFWQTMQWLRYEGLTPNAIEGIGRLLRRLFLVYLAYRKKKARYTKIEWLGQLLQIAAGMKQAATAQ